MILHKNQRVFEVVDSCLEFFVLLSAAETALEKIIRIEGQSAQFFKGDFSLGCLAALEKPCPIANILQLCLPANLSVPNCSAGLDALDDFFELVAIALVK